ncbi:hypothetical protein ATE47_07590 [Chryseobacterium sp. IHB B 17019]|nr:hypothetical protein ATE47_07590 [Chryseobacterium sp. IHB B 17019]
MIFFKSLLVDCCWFLVDYQFKIYKRNFGFAFLFLTTDNTNYYTNIFVCFLQLFPSMFVFLKGAKLESLQDI